MRARPRARRFCVAWRGVPCGVAAPIVAAAARRVQRWLRNAHVSTCVCMAPPPRPHAPGAVPVTFAQSNATPCCTAAPSATAPMAALGHTTEATLPACLLLLPLLPLLLLLLQLSLLLSLLLPSHLVSDHLCLALLPGDSRDAHGGTCQAEHSSVTHPASVQYSTGPRRCCRCQQGPLLRAAAVP